ncbi:MAG: DNA polymerase III subunit delta [Bacteroidia bacterium]|nr:DNA polymerase III subunit delta [Bacteroidia bacterium]NNM15320.1 DNA polymerase III subunit delta [Bacteroidia bacterium]
MAEFEQILKDLKNKVYHPVYFLQGHESYFIDKITSYIEENVLDESSREFNQVVLYGKEVDSLTVVNNAKRYPMMGNYSVVVLKEAQSLRGFGRSADDPLIKYIQNPLKSTVLVINYKYKELDGRTKLAKAIQKNAVFFNAKPLYENKVPDWINSYVSKNGYSIQPKASHLIAEFLGAKLSKVSNELDKIMLNIKEGSQINSDHVEKYIGISKEYNMFELQNAIGKRDILKSNRIVNYVSTNSKSAPLPVLLGTLYLYFSKILKVHQFANKKSKNELASVLGVPPFFVGDYTSAARYYPKHKSVRIIHWLRECDLKFKGVNNVSTSEGQLLQELVYKILHI